MFKFKYQNEKNEKMEKKLWVTKLGNTWITNRGKMDYKQEQLYGFQIWAKVLHIATKKFKIGAEITNRAKRDLKWEQGLQISVEQLSEINTLQKNLLGFRRLTLRSETIFDN